MKKLHPFFFPVFILLALQLGAQSEGGIDETFAEDGIFKFHFGADYYAYDAAQQTDGKLVIVGGMEVGSKQDVFVMRLNEDGGFDNSFQSLGFTAIQVTNSDIEMGLAVRLVGSKILVGGYSNFKGFVVRLNSDGSLDGSFGTDGIQILDDLITVNDIITVPGLSTYDIFVAGSIIDDWNTRPALARLHENGSPYSSFGTGGVALLPMAVKGFFNELRNTSLVGAGPFLVCGTNHTDGEVNDNALLAKFDADGDLVTAFGGGTGYVIIDAPTAGRRNNGEDLYLCSDGKITVCGDFYASADANAYAFRLNSNGTMDNSFCDSGYYDSGYGGETDEMNAIAVQPDDKIVLGGRSDYPGTFDFNLSRLNSDGSNDTSFGSGSWTMTDIEDSEDEIIQLLFDASGSANYYLYAIGNSTLGSDQSIAIVRYYAMLAVGVEETGILDLSVFPNPAAAGFIQVSYQLPEAMPVGIHLQSVEGKTLFNLLQADQMAGPHLEQLTLPDGCPAGTYFLQIRAGETVSSVPVVIH